MMTSLSLPAFEAPPLPAFFRSTWLEEAEARPAQPAQLVVAAAPEAAAEPAVDPATRSDAPAPAPTAVFPRPRVQRSTTPRDPAFRLARCA